MESIAIQSFYVKNFFLLNKRECITRKVKARKGKYGYCSVVCLLQTNLYFFLHHNAGQEYILLCCTIDAESAACASHPLAQVEERAGSVPDGGGG
jgi:hypothetical protein